MSDTAYQDRKHFLLELIQNADDAEFGDETHRLCAKLFDDRLELLYNEQGFTTDNVIAITGTGASTKTAKKAHETSFIGEKGIGFKSVFALAAEVEIESPPWHFKLSKDNIIVPIILREGSLKPGDGTRLVVRFKDRAMVDQVALELLKYVSGHTESFLFLRKLSEFTVEDHRTRSHGSPRSLLVRPMSRSGETLTVIEEPSEIAREYTIFHETLEFPPELVAARWERMAGTQESLYRGLTVAALNGSPGRSQGRLFCFLPTEVRLPVPLFLQVDGHLTAGRERLHDPENNAWNRNLLTHLPDFLIRAIIKWRESETVGPHLVDYIPIESGGDQLAGVFDTVIKRLMGEPWIRTFEGDSGSWTRPRGALIADSFWTPWLQQNSGFRSEAEDLLQRQFVHPKWVSNHRWDTVAKVYGIREISIDQEITVLSSSSLPHELIRTDSSLVALYRHLTEVLRKLGRSGKTSLRERILRCPIFPLGVGQFGSLVKDNDDAKNYWVSTRSRRSTGLKSTRVVRVVDSEYTYQVDARSDLTGDKLISHRSLKERNEAVRNLLVELEVAELDDEAVLSDLQIPYLRSNPELGQMDERYGILAYIFDAFRAKRNRTDERYLAELSRLRNAWLSTAEGTVDQIGSMLLPPELRLEEDDHLFDGTECSVLALPDYLLSPSGRDKTEENVRKWREDLHEFLKHCGIRATPEFTVNRTIYPDSWKFRFSDKDRYGAWTKHVRNEYTQGKPVTLEWISSDDATKYVAQEREPGQNGLLGAALYRAWQRYSEHIDMNLDTLYRRGSPPVGYFRASYKRRDDRSVAVVDSQWGGLARSRIPLTTLTGEVMAATECVRLSRVVPVHELEHSRHWFPMVEITENRGGPGYLRNYLESLQVNVVDDRHINARWQTVEPADRDSFVRAMVELIRTGLVASKLMLYDQQTNRLRPLQEFRRGVRLHGDVPYIEEQYGEIGRTLAELVGLRLESSVAVFCDTMATYLQLLAEGQEDPTVFEGLFKSWESMGAGDQRSVTRKMPDILSKFGAEAPLIMFKEHDVDPLHDTKALVGLLKSRGRLVVELSDIKGAQELYERMAQELGFHTLRDLGVLEYEGQKALTETERARITHLLEGYAGLLEPQERVRFQGHPLFHGDYETIVQRIIKADGIVRRVHEDFTLRVSFPHYDETRNLFTAGSKYSLEEVVARAISASRFAPYRSAMRDVQEVVKHKKHVLSARDDSGNQASSSASLEQFRARIDQDVADVPSSAHNALTMDWRVGLDPEEEAQLREKLAASLDKSLQEGLLFEPHQSRQTQTRNGSQGGAMKVADTQVLDPKEFLLEQYDGHCQICATELRLSNGGKWVETFRIDPREPTWAHRPFNILGLCPNCHALAKFGGGLDLRAIRRLAEDASSGRSFAIEVPDFHGDYYLTQIKFNGHQRRIVYSKTHLGHVIVSWLHSVGGPSDVSRP